MRLRRKPFLILLIGILLAAFLAHEALEYHRKVSLPWADPADPVRDALVETRWIWEQLALEKGMSVADVGAGGGYFTFKMAELVGPEGAVIATDADPDMVASLQRTLKHRPAPQIEIVEVPSDSLGLQRNSVDRILISNVYLFYTCDPVDTKRILDEARAALRPGGRLVILNDYVHLKGWQGVYGGEMPCDQMAPEEVIKLAGDAFRVRINVPSTAPLTGNPLELPGYLLSLEDAALRRLPAENVATAITPEFDED